MDSYQDLWNAIPAIQLHFFCESCERRYMKGWIQTSLSTCLFCRTYRIMECCPSRADLIRDMEWVFIQSGLEDKGAFYADYLNQIHRWSDAMGIPYTKEDMEWEQEIWREMEEA